MNRTSESWRDAYKEVFVGRFSRIKANKEFEHELSREKACKLWSFPGTFPEPALRHTSLSAYDADTDVSSVRGWVARTRPYA